MRTHSFLLKGGQDGGEVDRAEKEMLNNAKHLNLGGWIPKIDHSHYTSGLFFLTSFLSLFQNLIFPFWCVFQLQNLQTGIPLGDQCSIASDLIYSTWKGLVQVQDRVPSRDHFQASGMQATSCLELISLPSLVRLPEAICSQWFALLLST